MGCRLSASVSAFSNARPCTSSSGGSDPLISYTCGVILYWFTPALLCCSRISSWMHECVCRALSFGSLSCQCEWVASDSAAHSLIPAHNSSTRICNHNAHDIRHEIDLNKRIESPGVILEEYPVKYEFHQTAAVMISSLKFEILILIPISERNHNSSRLRGEVTGTDLQARWLKN